MLRADASYGRLRLEDRYSVLLLSPTELSTRWEPRMVGALPPGRWMGRAALGAGTTPCPRWSMPRLSSAARRFIFRSAMASVQALEASKCSIQQAGISCNIWIYAAQSTRRQRCSLPGYSSGRTMETFMPLRATDCLVMSRGDARDNDGDIIGSAVLIGKSDQVRRALLRRVLPDNSADLLIAHHIRESIRAEHQRIARL